MATLAEVLDVLDDHPHVALNLDIKQTAPAVEPYEELLARELAGRRGTDRVIVASFLDVATDSFAKYAPDIATSAGTLATAMFWRAVHEGEEPPAMAHVALQVPATQGDLVVVDELLVTRRPRARDGRPRVDDQRRARDGPTPRPGRRRHHLGPAHAARGAGGGARPGLPTLRPGADPSPRAWAQPRPALGRLPWLAFFLLRILRLTVRLDMAAHAIGSATVPRHRGPDGPSGPGRAGRTPESASSASR